MLFSGMNKKPTEHKKGETDGKKIRIDTQILTGLTRVRERQGKKTGLTKIGTEGAEQKGRNRKEGTERREQKNRNRKAGTEGAE